MFWIWQPGVSKWLLEVAMYNWHAAWSFGSYGEFGVCHMLEYIGDSSVVFYLPTKRLLQCKNRHVQNRSHGSDCLRFFVPTQARVIVLKYLLPCVAVASLLNVLVIEIRTLRPSLGPGQSLLPLLGSHLCTELLRSRGAISIPCELEFDN